MYFLPSFLFSFFLPILSEERGLNLVEGGVPLGVYNFAGVIGALLFGYLGDRMNRKTLIWGSILAAAPSLYGFLHTDGLVAYVMLALGGAMVMASNSLLVAMAQELLPKKSVGKESELFLHVLANDLLVQGNAETRAVGHADVAVFD